MSDGERPRLCAVVLAGVLAALVMIHYHDVSWYAPDEGSYAHVAERILDGEVLHRDVQDVHPGYINFVNAFALKVFGERLVSMRYPLVLLAMVQGAAVAWLLAHRGFLVAVAAGVATPFAGMLLFPGPSANWYGLTFALMLAVVLERTTGARRQTALLAGLVCGLALMFRQLTGAILGAAALVQLMLLQDPEEARAPRRPWLARAVVAVALAGTLGYVVWSTDAVGLILFGAVPLLVLLVSLAEVHPSNAEAGRRLGWFAAGIAIGALPMAVYVLGTGTVGEFFEDTVGVALAIPGVEEFTYRSYATYLTLGTLGVASLMPAATLTGAFWLALVCAPLGLALAIARRLFRGVRMRDLGGAVLVGAFAGLLMLHTPSPLYIGAGAPAVGVALMRLGRGPSRPWLIAAILVITCSAAWQVGWSRAIVNIWGRGQRPELVDGGGRNGLRIPMAAAHWYDGMLHEIARRTEPGDAIFVLPSNAELYFLAGRRNPSGFFNFALGVRTAGARDSLLGAFDRDPPRLVIYDPRDLFNSTHELAVVRWAARNADEIVRQRHVWLIDMRDGGRSDGAGDQ